jgi:hypothetical protein
MATREATKAVSAKRTWDATAVHGSAFDRLAAAQAPG